MTAPEQDCASTLMDHASPAMDADMYKRITPYICHLNAFKDWTGPTWKQRDKVLMILEQMDIDGVRADTCVYNSAMNRLQKSSYWQLALQLMEEMQAKGIAANTITYLPPLSKYLPPDQGTRPWA